MCRWAKRGSKCEKQLSALSYQLSTLKIESSEAWEPLVVREIDDYDSFRLFVRTFKFPLLHRLERALLKYRATACQSRGGDRTPRGDGDLHLHLATQTHFFGQRWNGR